ncbi:hypothetical protein [Desulfosporosinus sp. I2]|uniref:hypothetical protein n=1 Tax=Desulfosporosinus sp. I2 TaxID=1617025 RepID=UPI0005F0AA83|nr:hypothetical protein [Desulfosporosinus sp. I2]
MSTMLADWRVKFRPIVKQSISNAVLDRVSDGLYRQEVNTESNIIVENKIDDKIKSKEIITTDDDLKSFEYIKEMLAKYGRNVDQLGYKDTQNYFSIYVSNLNNWFIRINLG